MPASRTCANASNRLGGIFDYPVKRERLEEVTRELENPNVWDDPQRAQDLGRERARLADFVEGLDGISHGLDTPVNCWSCPPTKATMPP